MRSRLAAGCAFRVGGDCGEFPIGHFDHASVHCRLRVEMQINLKGGPEGLPSAERGVLIGCLHRAGKCCRCLTGLTSQKCPAVRRQIATFAAKNAPAVGGQDEKLARLAVDCRLVGDRLRRYGGLLLASGAPDRAVRRIVNGYEWRWAGEPQVLAAGHLQPYCRLMSRCRQQNHLERSAPFIRSGGFLENEDILAGSVHITQSQFPTAIAE
jgi:hypothetical protein